MRDKNTIMRATVMNAAAVANNFQIDDADLHLLDGYRVIAVKRPSGSNRPVARTRSKPIRNTGVGRLILAASPDVVVDHINGDPWDNRRLNLRVCSQRQNILNSRIGKKHSVGFKGVSRIDNRFIANIFIDGRNRSLGSFPTPQEAARAYDKAARDNFGSFACVNFAHFSERSAISGSTNV